MLVMVVVVLGSEYKSGDDTLVRGFTVQIPCSPRPCFPLRGSVSPVKPARSPPLRKYMLCGQFGGVVAPHRTNPLLHTLALNNSNTT
jgi:hypothetical protein